MSERRRLLIVEDARAKTSAQQFIHEAYEIAHRGEEWSLFTGRPCLLWPDATLESASAFDALAASLAIVCPEVKRLAAPLGPVGLTMADYAAWAAWAAPYVTFTLPAPAVVLSPGPTAITVAPADAGDTTGSPASYLAVWQDLGLALAGSGHPIPNLDNVMRVLERHAPSRALLWYDAFHQRLFTGASAREWRETDTTELVVAWQRQLGLARVTPDLAIVALAAYCRRAPRNALVAWLDSLAWDGTPRLEEFFPDLCGTPSDAYHRSVGKNFWLQLVARACSPGCRAQYVVYLIGPQGRYKSTAMEVIGGPYHTEAASSILDKDFYLALRGKLLVEIADLSSFRRADQEQIKALITRRVDTYRTPYARDVADHPRQCVFVCTTNEATPFADPTGARRFWPVACPQPLDLGYLHAQREQLFAEAVALYRAGVQWHEIPQEETEAIQESYRQRDPWEDDIRQFLAGLNGTYEVTTQQISSEGLHLKSDQKTRGTEMRISTILRGLGWVRMKLRVGGHPTWVFVSPDDPLERGLYDRS